MTSSVRDRKTEVSFPFKLGQSRNRTTATRREIPASRPGMPGSPPFCRDKGGVCLCEVTPLKSPLVYKLAQRAGGQHTPVTRLPRPQLTAVPSLAELCWSQWSGWWPCPLGWDCGGSGLPEFSSPCSRQLAPRGGGGFQSGHSEPTVQPSVLVSCSVCFSGSGIGPVCI